MNGTASEARGLSNKAAAYIVIRLDDGVTKAKEQKVYKSKVIKKESDPNWNDGSKILYPRPPTCPPPRATTMAAHAGGWPFAAVGGQ